MAPRPRLLPALAAVALLAACPARVDVAPAARKAAPPAARKSPSPRPTATAPASAAPAGGAPASAAATIAPAAAPARLRKPEVASFVLRGTVRIDAAYAAGAGTLVANNGGAVLALADIGLLANNGGNLISDSGGGLISDSGGALIANNGGGYRLAQAPPGAKLGEVLPAAGMLVRAASLRDGKAISLGVDGRGQPVFAIRSDAAGAYEVYMPADLAGNVLVTAEVPKTTDPRLRYDVVTPVAAAEVRPIDEDTVLVSRYLRRAYVNVLTDIFAAPDVEAMVKVVDGFGNLQPAVREVFAVAAREFRAAADDAGVTGAPRAELEALAERVADVFTARVDFDAAAVGEQAMPVKAADRAEAEKLLGAPLIPLATRLMRAVRETATARLGEDAGYFPKQPWFTAANAARTAAGRPAFDVKRPSDVGQVVIDAYLVSTNSGAFGEAAVALGAMGLAAEPGSGVSVRLSLLCLANTATLAIGGVMLTDPAAKADAIATIQGWGKEPSPPERP